MEYKAELIEAPKRSVSSLEKYQHLSAWGSGDSETSYGSESEVKYLQILRRHSRPLLAIMAACLLGGIVVTALTSPRYKAQTLVEVLAVNQDFMNNKDLDPNSTPTTMDSYLETQTKLLTSETVADRALAVLLKNGAQEADGRTDLFGRFRDGLGMQRPDTESLETQIRQAIQTLKVKAVGQSSLVSITVQGSSPKLAADTANAIATQHIETLQEARWNTAQRTGDFLAVQLQALQQKLQQSEDRLQQYARTTGLIYTPDSARESIVAEKLREIQSDLEKAEADRADKQAQTELANSSSPDSLPRVLDDGALREEKSRLADLRRQAANLSATLMPDHYKIREINAQIEAAEKQADQERSAIVSRMQNDFRAANRREQLQESAYERQLRVVADQSAKEVRYNLLKREVDANRDLYQSLLQKIKEATVVSALRTSNIRVVDPARLPSHPDQPNLLLNTGISVLAGCMLGLLFMLLRERADRSIRTPGESTRILQLPELAIIPAARRDIRTQIVSSTRKDPQQLNSFSLKRLSSRNPDSSADLLTNGLRSGSLVAESFRSAVTSILLRGSEGPEGVKVLVVTSAHCGAGKTTSVLNLGLGLVESGRRVLLIDGDLRLPTLGRVFGLKEASGLSDILALHLTNGEARERVRDTPLPGLHVLASGTRYPNAPQMLHSKALGSLIADFRKEYDFILIDTPPALPLTDARLLAQHADGVILVFRAGETSAEQSLSVRQCFSQDGTYIFGSILNGWNAVADDPAYLRSYMKYAG